MILMLPELERKLQALSALGAGCRGMWELGPSPVMSEENVLPMTRAEG